MADEKGRRDFSTGEEELKGGAMKNTIHLERSAFRLYDLSKGTKGTTAFLYAIKKGSLVDKEGAHTGERQKIKSVRAQSFQKAGRLPTLKGGKGGKVGGIKWTSPREIKPFL